MIFSQSDRESRAFSWVDYILYLITTYWFAYSAIRLISTGTPPNFLPNDFGIRGSLKEESDNFIYTIFASLFTIFLIFVYIRNFIVMHAIDDRRDGEHKLFYFVDYNLGHWSRLERIVRALIVLCVLTSAFGAVPLVTNTLWKTIELIFSSTVGYAAFQNITFMHGFFAYYGLVAFILFTLFITWDIINILSISRQIKSNIFKRHSFAHGNEHFSEVIHSRELDYAIPHCYKNTTPVYCIVAYIRPSIGLIPGDIGKFHNRPSRRKKIEDRVQNGALLTLYFSFSKKFTERMTGLLVGLFLLLAPLSEEKGSIFLFCAFVGLIVYAMNMWTYTLETVGAAVGHLSDFLRYVPRHWSDEARSKTLGKHESLPSDEH